MSDSDPDDIFEMEQDKPPSYNEDGGVSTHDDANDKNTSDWSWVTTSIKNLVKNNPEVAVGAAAVKTLAEVVRASKASTMMGLQIELKEVAEELKKISPTKILSISSSCELFIKFVTRTSLDIPDFEQCKTRLIERGEKFIQKTEISRQKIAELAHRFIRDGATLLTHGFSRCVCAVLLAAAAQHKRFTVFVTESRPDNTGLLTAQRLEKAGVLVHLITDSSVGYYMEQVDLVLVGAEGITECGGIVNQIGTYQISIVSKVFKRPLYVCAESFKFARLYPLNQKDIPNEQYTLTLQNIKLNPQNVKLSNPYLDYTPPQYITLLFTDLGVLTPSAVSDELIKLYY